MTAQTVYLLERGSELLARLPLIERQGEVYQCGFEPTAAFEPHRELFEEDAAVAEALTLQNEVEFMERPTELSEAIEALHLTVRREGEGVGQQVLLGIDPAMNSATFRPLNPQEPL